jgi:hypothetical protein
MSDKTISYSPAVRGFPTFYSYIPESIIGMSNNLYTFKGGNIFKHHSNESRCEFYGVHNSPNCSITMVFNQSPTENKVFKTIALESDDSWKAEVVTDLQSGIIESSWFEEKEGTYFAFIRAYEDVVNLKQRSIDGVGSLSSIVNVGGTSYELTFDFNIGSILSVGDDLYFNSSPEPLLIGPITNISGKVITVNATAGPIPSVGYFIFSVKNPQAESHGPLGYYCEVKLTNENTQPVELFSIESSVFKSYP